MAVAEERTAGLRHPLEPLSAEEISAAVAILRAERRLGERVRIMEITLQEPPKQVVCDFRAGDVVERAAFVVLLDNVDGKTYEAVVSLSARKVSSWEHIPNVQPAITFDEFVECEAACRADPAWQAAMRRRGIDAFDLCMVDPWSSGHYGIAEEEGRRLVRALTWLRSAPEDNGYARPIENVITVVDLNAMRVLAVEDGEVVPLPTEHANYTVEAVGGGRTDLKPIEIHQPEGPSFQLDGHEVRWQKWRFRVGFTPREGLVLYTVSYADGGRERPIVYRASICDMVVPYGDPRPHYNRRNAFDVGEYGLGGFANSLELGCDCLGEIRYLDATIADTRGRPMHRKNVICLHEEDFGILWKHLDLRTDHAEVRRSRRLVVSMIATVGNYDYGFYWYFYQDGSLQLEVKLTGIVSNGAVRPGERPRWGAIVAPGVYAPIHQHFFSARLDVMVDGWANSVYEVNTEADPPGPDNPLRNAFHETDTLLARESEATRVVNPLSARYWKIVNPGVHNAHGSPVAYKLQPGENVLPFADPEASVIKRAGFMTRHLWVTRYDPRERYAAGDYPNQHPGGDGLPAYTSQDRPIVDDDLVVWYTFGAHHAIRPEDWPVMPVSCIGFALRPLGFFDRNPALDVAPPMPHGATCH